MDTETRSPQFRAGHANGRDVATKYVHCHTGRQVDAAIATITAAVAAAADDPTVDDYTHGYQAGRLDTLVARRDYARNT